MPPRVNLLEGVASQPKQDEMIALLEAVEAAILAGGGGGDGLTNAELRSLDVEVNDDVAQSLIQAVVDSLGTTTDVDTVRYLLNKIYESVDGLELSADSITVNLAGVESRLDTLNINDFATEPTLGAILLAVQDLLATVQTNGLTDTELRATPVVVETGLTPLTEAQLRQAPLDVNTGLTPLTDTELRAAPVFVDTGLTPLTDAELRDAPLDVNTGLAPLTDAELRAAPVSVIDRAVTPTVHETASVVTDDVVLTPSVGTHIRILGYTIQLAPDAIITQEVEIKLGSQVIYRGFFEASQPWAEGRVFNGGLGDPLTVSTTSAGRTVFNFRTEEF